jgi:hypothetical protein
MNTKDLLRRVTGSSKFICILALGPEKGKRTQRFYSTIDAARTFAEASDARGSDVYFALGRFDETGSRESDAVSSMRSFFLDLDCGPGKDYPDQASALRALRDFVKATKLVKPIIVNSGRGLHVYWPLTEDVTFDEWHPVALRLKSACVALGLRCDPTATADAARVLRVPDTHNHKDNPPKQVRVLTGHDTPDTPLAVFDASVSPHAADVPAAPAFGGLFADPTQKALITESGGLSALSTALLGNIETSFKKIAARSVAGRGCAQIALMLSSPETVSEPMWRAGLSVASLCVEKKAIYWLSQGHPDFDPEDTAVKASRIKGPYLCTRFDENNPGVCRECPHWGKIKSPIVLGHVFQESEGEVEVVAEPQRKKAPRSIDAAGTITIPAYPPPYLRGKDGGVYLKTKDEDGEPEVRLICATDLYVVRRLVDPELGEVVEMRHHLPMDGVRTFVVPLYSVTSKEEFRKALAAQGVAAMNKEVDALMSYTQTWVRELQHTVQADNAHRQFGWLKDMSGFVLGDRVIFADRVEHNAPSSGTRGLTDLFEPTGTLEAWKHAMNFYNRSGFELHQFAVCAGFGSLLMRFMPVNAALIHFWSKDSGFGKTTALHAALSTWGNPERLILTEKDTYNSKMNRADVMHSIPVCMDEITNIQPKDGSDLIYQITGGQQRNRLSQNGNSERFRGEPWDLLFLSTGNSSLIDRVAMAKAMPKAEAQRVLEIEVSRLFTQKEDKVITDEFSRSLLVNYGHAGTPFVQYILQNPEQVALLVDTVQKKIDAEAKLGPENRFWSAAVAASISAAVICKHLGLMDYNVRKLRTFLIDRVLKSNQTASGAMDVDAMSLVNEYVYQNWGRIIQIKSTADLRGKHHGNGLDDLIVPEHMPRGNDIVGRYETDLAKLYLIIKPFKHWLAEQQLNYASVLEALKAEVKAVKVRARITKGTTMNLPAVDALAMKIDMSDLVGDPVSK